MASQTALDEKPRSELVEEARQMGVERPERMTRVELRDEITRRSVPEDQQAEARGLFGVARSMLASVVDKGLNLPDAAKAIRGESSIDLPPGARAPVATVTLAEIYAAQGHKQRALRVLDDVLRLEPDHEEALRVRNELLGVAKEKVEIEQVDRTREAVTAEAPPVAEDSGATTEYVPSGEFVETTGEEIRTGKPPMVETVSGAPSAFDEPPAFEASREEEPTVGLPTVEEVDLSDTEAEPPSERAIEAEPEEAEPEAAEPEAAEPEAAEPEAAEPEEAEPEAAEPEAAEPEAAEPEDVESPGAFEPPRSTATGSPALVLVQTDAGLSLYWELPRATLEQCSVDEEEGRAAIRIVAFSPAGAVPDRQERTIGVGETTAVHAIPGCHAGTLRLEDFAEPVAVRAALGWETDDGFLPLTVGRSIEEWGADRQGGAVSERARSYL